MLDSGQQRRTVIGMSENEPRIDISLSGSTFVFTFTVSSQFLCRFFNRNSRSISTTWWRHKIKNDGLPSPEVNLKLNCELRHFQNCANDERNVCMTNIMSIHLSQIKLHRIWMAKVTLKLVNTTRTWQCTVTRLGENKEIWREMYRIMRFDCHRWIWTIQKPSTLTNGDSR